MAELVADEVGADQLILVTRTPDALARLAGRGAIVRYGDFDHPEHLIQAFAGGERMLIVSTPDLDRRARQQEAAIRAAVAAGVRHVVYTSCLSPEPPNPALVAASHYATEQALRTSGLGWTILRNGLYAELQVLEAERAARTGKLVHNRGSGRTAYVSREDCAAAAAAALVTDGHEGRIYEITGTQALSAAELAALYGELVGREIEEVALDDEDFVGHLLEGSEADDQLRYRAELLASLGRAIREGLMAACTDHVARLAGRQPRTLRHVLELAGWPPTPGQTPDR